MRRRDKEVRSLEETGTDLIEVMDVDEEVGRDSGSERGEETDLGTKVLTKKMMFLMEKISDYGYLSLPEVQMIYANQSHAYKVLKTLKGKGLAGEFPTEELPQKAYYLRPKGYRTLEKFERLRHSRRFVPSHYKRFIFNHRLACARVGLVLEKHPLVGKFMPEVLLWDRRKSERDKLCDGEFWYKVSAEQAERVGLEVELTLKNREKIDGSLRDLNERKDLAQIWWICADDTILRALQREVLARTWIEQRHLFCLMKDFMARKEKAFLYSPQGEEFTIDPAAPTLKSKPAPLPPPKPLPAIRPAPRAEVPPQPQPAPKPPQVEEVSLFAAAWRCLRQLWEDLRAVVEFLVERPYFIWVPAAIFLSGSFYLADPLDLFIPEPPAKPWFARTIINAHDIENTRGTWAVKRLTLRSRGDNYRMSLKLLNPDGFWCGLMGFTVMDANRQVLDHFHIKGGDWIFAHHYWEGSVAFKAPRKATQILLGIESDGSDCGNMEIPVVYN